MQQNDFDKILTISDITEYLRVSRSTVQRYVRNGRLPSPLINIGGSPRWRKIDIDAHLAKISQRK